MISADSPTRYDINTVVLWNGCVELQSVLYVSRSNIDFPKKAYLVGDLVRWSVSWNRRVGITGALAFTETHFSQYIEGPPQAISELVSKILCDDRHCNVDVIRIATTVDRTFQDWSLAFSGPDVFTGDYLRPLIERDLEDKAFTDQLADNWIRFLKEMAAATQTHI